MTRRYFIAMNRNAVYELMSGKMGIYCAINQGLGSPS